MGGGWRGKPGDLGRHFRERHCLNLFWEGPADQLDYLFQTQQKLFRVELQSLGKASYLKAEIACGIGAHPSPLTTGFKAWGGNKKMGPRQWGFTKTVELAASAEVERVVGRRRWRWERERERKGIN